MDDTERAMRAHGWHRWTDNSRAVPQRFWCRCELGRDHRRDPLFPDVLGSGK